MEAAHPEWEEREHPDLTWTTEIGFVQPKPPMTPEELHHRIMEDASSAASQLRQHRSTNAFGEDTWSGTLGVVSATVQQWPADGYTLLDALAADDSALAAAVINGWAAATLADDDDATDVAERVRTLDLTTPAIRDAVVDMLSADSGAPSSSTVWHRLSAARNLARDAWIAIGADTSTSQPESWLGWAINHPAGKLAQFWLQAIAADWRTAGESWTGLPEALRESLDACTSFTTPTASGVNNLSSLDSRGRILIAPDAPGTGSSPGGVPATHCSRPASGTTTATRPPTSTSSLTTHSAPCYISSPRSHYAPRSIHWRDTGFLTWSRHCPKGSQPTWRKT
jgi:hypothetical protein